MLAEPMQQQSLRVAVGRPEQLAESAGLSVHSWHFAQLQKPPQQKWGEGGQHQLSQVRIQTQRERSVHCIAAPVPGQPAHHLDGQLRNVALNQSRGPHLAVAAAGPSWSYDRSACGGPLACQGALQALGSQ